MKKGQDQIMSECVEYMIDQIENKKRFSWEFGCTELANAVGGYAPNIGSLHNEIIQVLYERGYNARKGGVNPVRYILKRK